MLLGALAGGGAALDCGGGSGGGGAGSGGVGGTGGATGGTTGGTTSGTGGAGGPCSIYGLPVTSTVNGAFFHNWEGEPVRGEFLPVQSFPPGSAISTVVDGGFSLTASACTGVFWQISVGAIGREISCGGRGSSLTPAGCWCQNGPAWAPGGASGQDCAAFDGGARDASAD